MSSSPQLDDVIPFLVLDFARSFLPDVLLIKLFYCCYLGNRKMFLAVIFREAPGARVTFSWIFISYILFVVIQSQLKDRKTNLKKCETGYICLCH
jgi:hypothetical protein